GTDTVHISGVHIFGAMNPPDTSFPQSDFRFGSYNYKIRYDTLGRKHVSPLSYLPTASIDSNWILAPQETAFVEVIAHPHHSGVRGGGDQLNSPDNYAYVQFDNDANHEVLDQACLTLVGIVPAVGIE